jgi:hypothetical protein
MQALEFIAPLLQTGTFLYFDNWFIDNGDMSKGEARACHDWLIAHPEFTVVDYGNVGMFGKMFIVNCAE